MRKKFLFGAKGNGSVGLLKQMSKCIRRKQGKTITVAAEQTNTEVGFQLLSLHVRGDGEDRSALQSLKVGSKRSAPFSPPFHFIR